MIQRYDVVYRIDENGEGYQKVRDIDGAYVLYADYLREINKLKSSLKEKTQCSTTTKRTTTS